MQSAETVLGVLRERGRRGLPLERTVSAAVQPGVVSAGLRAHLLQQGRDDARGHGRKPWTACHWPRSSASSRRCATSATGSARSGGCYIPKKNGKTAPAGAADLVGQAGRRGGAPAAGGVLRAAVLRPVPRVPSRPGLPHRVARGGQHLDRDDLVHRGRHRRLLRQSWTMRSCSRSWRRRSTTTGSCGWCATCSRPDTWRTGSGTPRSAGVRKAGSSHRSCPTSTCTGWTSLSRRF